MSCCTMARTSNNHRHLYTLLVLATPSPEGYDSARTSVSLGTTTIISATYCVSVLGLEAIDIKK
ncbi:hypothetical protein J6590_016090 [Homalodisca vitripennis]|nr:hypothetical protein J6590_016090 [Homalodisca vitripennis]